MIYIAIILYILNYEVIYHDEVDNTETRIMNPERSGIIPCDGYNIKDDFFTLHFQRIVRKEDYPIKKEDLDQIIKRLHYNGYTVRKEDFEQEDG